AALAVGETLRRRRRRPAEREHQQCGSEKAERRHGSILSSGSRFFKRTSVHWFYVGLIVGLAGRHFCSDDIVGLDPSGGTDGETGFGARGEFARGLVVAAQERGLCGRQISLRVISLSAISHCELGITERRLGLSCDGRAQNRNGVLCVGLIISGHERLPK